MQIETYIIVAGLLVGWIATAFFLIKARKKAFARGFDRGANLAREQNAASSACTLEDHELMTNVTTSLRLAVETWQAFQGTEIMVGRVNKQRLQLSAFAAKMWLAAYPAQLDAEA
ncbi:MULTISPECIES: hypothetical protein [unclassified Pseudomonas]|uniref:hypothetical protein n=1 Tax=unclassified Pseudomonas TaxID=196821 RepID=UPI000F576AA4|nr:MULTISPECIES: hypothetical protein [unclassified Pseudomonas]AZF64197.1 hypothetical protein C4J83_3209 [Pseudomonas sp. LBUM920]